MLTQQNFDVPVSCTAADGSAVALDAGAVASCEDPSVTLTLNPEQTSVNVRSGDSVGTFTLTVSGAVNGLPANPASLAFEVSARPVPATITLGEPSAPVDN